MIVLYNSDSFAVMQIDLPADDGASGDTAAPGRSGYEIVDKFARKGIFLGGDLAADFRAGVEALAQETQDTDEIDAYLALFTGGASQPMVLH